MVLLPFLTPPVIHLPPGVACSALRSQSCVDSAASSVTDEEACGAVPVIRAASPHQPGRGPRNVRARRRGGPPLRGMPGCRRPYLMNGKRLRTREDHGDVDSAAANRDGGVRTAPSALAAGRVSDGAIVAAEANRPGPEH